MFRSDMIPKLMKGLIIWTFTLPSALLRVLASLGQRLVRNGLKKYILLRELPNGSHRTTNKLSDHFRGGYTYGLNNLGADCI